MTRDAPSALQQDVFTDSDVDFSDDDPFPDHRTSKKARLGQAQQRPPGAWRESAVLPGSDFTAAGNYGNSELLARAHGTQLDSRAAASRAEAPLGTPPVTVGFNLGRSFGERHVSTAAPGWGAAERTNQVAVAEGAPRRRDINEQASHPHDFPVLGSGAIRNFVDDGEAIADGTGVLDTGDRNPARHMPAPPPPTARATSGRPTPEPARYTAEAAVQPSYGHVIGEEAQTAWEGGAPARDSGQLKRAGVATRHVQESMVGSDISTSRSQARRGNFPGQPATSQAAAHADSAPSNVAGTVFSQSMRDAVGDPSMMTTAAEVASIAAGSSMMPTSVPASAVAPISSTSTSQGCRFEYSSQRDARAQRAGQVGNRAGQAGSTTFHPVDSAINRLDRSQPVPVPSSRASESPLPSANSAGSPVHRTGIARDRARTQPVLRMNSTPPMASIPSASVLSVDLGASADEALWEEANRQSATALPATSSAAAVVNDLRNPLAMAVARQQLDAPNRQSTWKGGDVPVTPPPTAWPTPELARYSAATAVRPGYGHVEAQEAQIASGAGVATRHVQESMVGSDISTSRSQARRVNFPGQPATSQAAAHADSAPSNVAGTVFSQRMQDAVGDPSMMTTAAEVASIAAGSSMMPTSVPASAVAPISRGTAVQPSYGHVIGEEAQTAREGGAPARGSGQLNRAGVATRHVQESMVGSDISTSRSQARRVNFPGQPATSQAAAHADSAPSNVAGTVFSQSMRDAVGDPSMMTTAAEVASIAAGSSMMPTSVPASAVAPINRGTAVQPSYGHVMREAQTAREEGAPARGSGQLNRAGVATRHVQESMVGSDISTSRSQARRGNFPGQPATSQAAAHADSAPSNVAGTVFSQSMRDAVGDPSMMTTAAEVASIAAGSSMMPTSVPASAVAPISSTSISQGCRFEYSSQRDARAQRAGQVGNRAGQAGSTTFHPVDSAINRLDRSQPVPVPSSRASESPLPSANSAGSPVHRTGIARDRARTQPVLRMNSTPPMASIPSASVLSVDLGASADEALWEEANRQSATALPATSSAAAVVNDLRNPLAMAVARQQLDAPNRQDYRIPADTVDHDFWKRGEAPAGLSGVKPSNITSSTDSSQADLNARSPLVSSRAVGIGHLAKEQSLGKFQRTRVQPVSRLAA